ncbi:hypothetical protein [Streptomyces antibioticus]|uniref:hypothetical protein n=1 Tax=Streptomyces antibioticus TaxID=1890 RepID=UPI0036A687E0
MTARLEALGEDGEWHEIPGVTSVELRADIPDPPPASERTPLLQLHHTEQSRAVRDAAIAFVWAYAEAVKPVVEALARGIEAYGQALRQAGLIDQEGRPVARRDRPAWQSPYGPPTRRR